MSSPPTPRTPSPSTSPERPSFLLSDGPPLRAPTQPRSQTAAEGVAPFAWATAAPPSEPARPRPSTGSFSSAALFGADSQGTDLFPTPIQADEPPGPGDSAPSPYRGRSSANPAKRFDQTLEWLVELTGQPEADLELYEELWLDGADLPRLPLSFLRLCKLKYLVLSNNRLSVLPSELQPWGVLRVLILSNNQLSAIPPQIQLATELQELYLVHNQLLGLPSTISSLSALQLIQAQHNRLSSLPISIGSLAALKVLNVSCNQINHLPESIGKLTKLKNLYLSENNLQSLPDGFFSLVSLRDLRIDKNRISSLPEALAKFPHLQYFNASNNALTSIPNSIDRIIDLEELHLANNRIATLPNTFVRMRKLTLLDVEGNPIRYPPWRYIREGVPSLRNYLKEQDPLKEMHLKSRVLIMGPPGCGKTTLVRSLLKKYLLFWNSSLDDTIPPSSNIEISQVPLDAYSSEKSLVSLDIWDFPGTEDTAPCIPVFLTPGSLVVLAWNMQNKASDSMLDRWLNLIRNIAPKCRVVIVGTFSDSSAVYTTADKHISDVRQLITPFETSLTIHPTFIRTSNKSGEGIEDLKRCLADVALTMPLVNSELPHKYLLVSDLVYEWRSQRISPIARIEEFHRAASNMEIKQDEMEKILSFLHDQGLITWCNCPQIKNQVILDPKELIRSFPILAHLKKDSLLHDTIIRSEISDMVTLPTQATQVTATAAATATPSQTMPSEVDIDGQIQMLRHFFLSFPGDTYMEAFPTILSPQMPLADYWEFPSEFHWTREFTFAFQYSFLPSGLFARLVAVFQDFSVRNKGRLLFYSATHFILVTSSLLPEFTSKERQQPLLSICAHSVKHKHMVVLRVRFGNQMNVEELEASVLLTRLMDGFSIIHGLYPGITHDIGVVCPQCQSFAGDVSHYFNFTDLKQGDQSQDTVQCPRGHVMTKKCALQGTPLLTEGLEERKPSIVAHQPNLFVAFKEEKEAKVYFLCEAPNGPHVISEKGSVIRDWEGFRRIFYHRLLAMAGYAFEFTLHSNTDFGDDGDEHLDLKRLFRLRKMASIKDYQAMLDKDHQDEPIPPQLQSGVECDIRHYLESPELGIENQLNFYTIHSGRFRWVCKIHSTLYESG